MLVELLRAEYSALIHVRNVEIPRASLASKVRRGASQSRRGQHEDASYSPLHDSSKSIAIVDAVGMLDEMRL